MSDRIKKKIIRIGDRHIGGSFPVLIQSMTNTKTENISATVAQIRELQVAGCEIIRVAVPTMEAARALRAIREQISIPLVADIHFDYRLALASIEAGVDKIRINPGNIGSKDRVKAVVDAAKGSGIPIRVGVNSGSLEKEIEKEYGGVTPQALVESAMRQVRYLEELDFGNIVVSIKSSDVRLNTDAYELIHPICPYPLHLGVTEAGTSYSGLVKSSVGLGALLLRGIGDTIRVSLTADPVEEIRCAREILSATGLRRFGIQVISCPTCGRTEVDLIELARKVEERVKGIDKPLTIAVMGCVVNGPGEARHADLGVAGGKGEYLLFRKGIILRKLPESQVFDALLEEIEHA